MDWEYLTYEAASNAVDQMTGSTIADNPEISGDDVEWEITIAIAGYCPPKLAKELCRRRLGYIPVDVEARQ